MGALDAVAARVAEGRTVEFRPSGSSMVPLIRSRQLVTVAPVDPAKVEVGDIVLARVAGTTYLHLVSAVDATRGRVNLVSTTGTGAQTQLAWFYDGIFKIGQTRGAKPITDLALAEVLAKCPKAKAKAKASAAAKKKTRKLWGEGKGAFRTTGKYSSATVRGTKWVVTDRCDGTLTRVAQGSVLVRDFKRKRNKVVRAGKQYLARR